MEGDEGFVAQELLGGNVASGKFERKFVVNEGVVKADARGVVARVAEVDAV